MRHLSEEEAFEIVKLAEKFYGIGVVGIDIAGDEKSFPVSKFKMYLHWQKIWELILLFMQVKHKEQKV